MVLEGKELARLRESLLAQTDALIAGTEEEKRLTLAAIAKAEEEKSRRIDDPQAWAQADAMVARADHLSGGRGSRSRPSRQRMKPVCRDFADEPVDAHLTNRPLCSAFASQVRVTFARLWRGSTTLRKTPANKAL
jgi:hypothetical protein